MAFARLARGKVFILAMDAGTLQSEGRVRSRDPMSGAMSDATKRARGHWRLLAAAAIVAVAGGLGAVVRAQDAAPTTPAPSTAPAPAAPAASPAAAAVPANPTSGAPANSAARPDEPVVVMHGIANGVSVELPATWTQFSPEDSPAALAPYMPPFHLSGILALQDLRERAILQFATSDNPLIGHDSNWLDAQMHAPSGSGMSLTDFLFYYFFPPSNTCISEAMENNARASFAPSPDSTSSTSPPLLQVSYTCRHEPTLAGFFGAQVSSGITFVQTNQGPRAYGQVAQFYLAPMERVTSPGMTWYVFSAQRLNPVSQNATNHYNLPAIFQGLQAEFFWAIGSAGAFPWVNDAGHGNPPLIHVAYAAVAHGGNKRADFLALLQKVQASASAAAGPQ
jgi:hypothetical protein